MSENGSNVAGFLKWAGGIAASVLTAVLIYYFTKPPVVPPVPVAIAQTGFDGFVQDAASHSLLRGATMTLTLGQNSIVQITDGSGKYSVVLPSPTSQASMGEVAITAAGYQAYRNSVELKPGDNYAVIPIDAAAKVIVPAPTSEASVGAGAAPTTSAPTAPAPPPPYPEPRANILATTLPPNFVRARTKFFNPHP